MAGDAGAGGFAKVKTEIHAVRGVEFDQGALGLLSDIDDFVGSGGGKGGERAFVTVRDDHDVAGRIREGIKAEEGVFGAKDDACGALGFLDRHTVFLRIGDCGDEIAEDAMMVARPCGQFIRNALARRAVSGADVGIAPGRPEVIHIGEYIAAAANACFSGEEGE